MKVSRVKLGDLCHVVTKGTTPTSVGFDFSDDGIPFLRIQNLNNRSVEFDHVLYISEQTHKALSRSIIRPKDFLITIAGTIGKVAIVPDHFPECNCNQAIAILRFDYKKLNPHYLLHWLATSDALEQITGRKVTATISNLSLGQIKQLEIPLPPLAEQQKIAAILDAADSLRQKDQQLVERYTALSQSLFLEMFGDPVTNSMGWDISNLEECLSGICGGTSVGGEERNIKAWEKAVLKISAVTSGSFDPMQYKVVEMQDIPENPISPQIGDLIFSRANTRDLVGATCIVDKTYENFFLPDKLWRLDLKPAKATNWYIKFLLTHDGFRENLRKVATGTSGSMLNISKAKLQQLKIPLPSVVMQNQFAERIQLIEAQKQQAQRSLEKSEALFNSLLQRAFTGELTAKMAA